jgi:hypothetical protein
MGAGRSYCHREAANWVKPPEEEEEEDSYITIKHSGVSGFLLCCQSSCDLAK